MIPKPSKFISHSNNISLLITSLLFRCNSVLQFKEAHAQLIAHGLTHPPKSLRPVISFAALNPSGDLTYALRLALSLPSSPLPHIFIFNTLIRGLARSSSAQSLSNSVLVFRRIRALGIDANNFTFTFLFQACSNLDGFGLGKQLHGLLVKNSFDLDVFARNSVIQYYAVSGDVEDARRVFEGSGELDIVSWNSMINGYVRNGDILEALNLFDKMSQRNDVSWNSVLGALVKFGCLDDAYRVFDLMPTRNLVSWAVMISGCAQNRRPKEALELFRMMQSSDQKPNSVVLVSIISACSQLGALDHGNWIYSYIKRSKIKMDSVLVAALVDMYAKCGEFELAMQVFISAKEKDVSVYTATIMGLAMNGRFMEAIELFDSMDDEVNPDAVCFIALLSACSHAGWVEKGYHYFNSMTEVHGIEPELEHYACMVDMLCRAGLLGDAEDFISLMPIKPDSVIWDSLLGACEVHGDAERIQRVGNFLKEDDGLYDGHFILSNTDESSEQKQYIVRKPMMKNKLKHVPGCSMVEVDDCS